MVKLTTIDKNFDEAHYELEKLHSMFLHPTRAIADNFPFAACNTIDRPWYSERLLEDAPQTIIDLASSGIRVVTWALSQYLNLSVSVVFTAEWGRLEESSFSIIIGS
jgi:hypothetical protein